MINLADRLHVESASPRHALRYSHATVKACCHPASSAQSSLSSAALTVPWQAAELHLVLGPPQQQAWRQPV